MALQFPESPPVLPTCEKRPRRAAARQLAVLYTIAGFAALVWFLIRVVPKPSRAAYPCQRLAFPVATSFVLWVIGLTASIFAFRKAGIHLRQARYAIAGACAALGIAIAGWALSLPGEPASAEWIPSDPPNSPMGVAKGINPGRVVWVHDPLATSWDGTSNYWWSDANTDQAVVDEMMSRSIRRLTDAASDAAAWDAIFRHFNRTHGRDNAGYQAGELIAIKINMNVSPDYALTNEPISSPQVVLALLRQLINQGGVAASDITVYDASRCITDAIFLPCHAEFPTVKFVDNSGQGDRDAAAQDTTVAVRYTDSNVLRRTEGRFPTCAVNATYLINLALLRGHSMAGVTLGGKNHFGSVWFPDTGFSPSNIHSSANRGSAMGTANSLVDLIGHKHLGGKTLLFMIDALYAAVNQGSARPNRWQSSPFENDWTSSLFVSQDGVALDSVGVDFCRNEPTLNGTVTGTGVDNYLHEAALADNPPSGAFYDPEGDGTRLASLGVHEHWNDAARKQYSRNLGTGDGIELVPISMAGGFTRGDVNADRKVDVSDVVTTLRYLFGDQSIPCVSSADVNDVGAVDVADAVYLLEYLFAGGGAPPEPFAACGFDPTPPDLGCDSFPPCGQEDPGTPVVLLAATNPATVLIPTDDTLGLAWTQTDFNDAAWINGTAAVGYDEESTYLPHFTTDVRSVMNDVNTTAYIRVPFTVDSVQSFKRLTLWIKYDDGFIAYLNGTKVAEMNPPSTPQWNSPASGQHDDSLAVSFEPMDITSYQGELVAGANLLAIHGLNVGLTSSDFLIAVELEARVPAS
jgi:uncharacterized protein (DUF362 family)